MRSLIHWCLLLSCLGNCPQLFGLSSAFQLNRTNIQDIPFIKIHSTNESPDTIRFRVIVVPERAVDPAHFEGGLSVYDASSNLVASCFPISSEKLPIKSHEVAAEYRGKSVVFEFRVASSMLRYSRFYASNLDTNGPAMDAYWFYLKDFVEPGIAIERDPRPGPGGVEVIPGSWLAQFLNRIASKQLTASGRSVLLKTHQPIESAKQILSEIQKVAERPIVAMTQDEDWIWFATDVVRDSETKTIRSFVGGYVARKGGQEVVKWSVW